MSKTPQRLSAPFTRRFRLLRASYAHCRSSRVYKIWSSVLVRKALARYVCDVTDEIHDEISPHAFTSHKRVERWLHAIGIGEAAMLCGIGTLIGTARVMASGILGYAHDFAAGSAGFLLRGLRVMSLGCNRSPSRCDHGSWPTQRVHPVAVGGIFCCVELASSRVFLQLISSHQRSSAVSHPDNLASCNSNSASVTDMETHQQDVVAIRLQSSPSTSMQAVACMAPP